jgi:hypothetical protein
MAGLAITSEDWRVLYRKPSLSTTGGRDPFLLLALRDLPRREGPGAAMSFSSVSVIRLRRVRL